MAKGKYQATNLITGLGKADIPIGGMIELDEADATPFVAGGSLVLVEEAAAAPPVDDKGGKDKK